MFEKMKGTKFFFFFWSGAKNRPTSF